MEASDIVGDILDRLEDALKARTIAEFERNDAAAKARVLERSVEQAEHSADCVRDTLRTTEQRLSFALNLLNAEQRLAYDASLKSSRPSDEIPF